MRWFSPVTASAIGIVTLVCVSLVCVNLVFVSKVHSQTLRLKSSDLNVLTGSERAQFLKAHNAARKEVGVDPVDWSEELSQQAINSLARQKDALIEQAKEGWTQGLAVLPAHQADSEYGENVAGWAGTKPIAAPWAVESWLSEKAAFDKLNAMAPYRVGDEIGMTETDARGNERPIIVGHYTAIVWRATKHIGAAKLRLDLKDEEGRVRSYVAIICDYAPAGNWRGERPF